MFAICKKELGQFFSSLTGIIAIVVFLLVNGIVLFVFRNNILESGYATLESFFSFAPWILIFLIPAITMRSFADEFRSGSFEVLRTRPLTAAQIVNGKFYGSFIIVIISLLPTIVYYFTVNHLASTVGIDAGAATGSYLGLLLLAAVFTAVSIAVSSYTSNSVIAFIVSIVALIMIYYGFNAISQLSLFASGADYYIQMLGIDFHYQSISRGVLDTRDLVYFISLIVFFLFITKKNIESRESKKRKNIYWLYSIAALIAINFLASVFHARYDLTEEKRYSLSKPTRSLLSSLDTTVIVDVFVEGNDMPAVVRRFRNSLGDFLSEMKEYSGAKLQVNFINPYANTDTAAVRLFQDSLQVHYGLYPVPLNAPEKVGDKMEINNIIHGAVIRYKDRSSGVDLLKGMRSFGTEPEQLAALYNNIEAGIEYKFASAIQKLTIENLPAVAYLKGNGEGWGFNINDAFLTLQQEYDFDTLNLQEAPLIPPQIDALVILKPTIPFTDADKFKIDQYVMNGGKVFWMIDNMYAEFDSLYKSQGFIAFDRGLNLEDILFNYGTRLDQSLVQDMQCDQLPQVSDNGQQRLVEWPFFPVLNGTSHPISKNLDGIRTMFPTRLDTVQAPNIKKTILLETSDNARVITAPAKIDFEFLQIAPDAKLFQQKKIPVAVLLEGKFRSLYRGRVSQQHRDTLKKYNSAFAETSAEGNKMIVVADGDIAMNQYSPSAGPLPMGMNLFTRYTFANKEFFSNCLDYLVNPTDILQTRSKEFTLRLLDPKKVKQETTKWQLINIVIPVLLVILFGFIYQQLRKRKYTASGSSL
jgi:ABC-2 type transport system permease protein